MEAPDMRGAATILAILVAFALLGLGSFIYGVIWVLTHVRISW